MMTVAAVVVTIGRPELSRAIASILGQTRPVDEIMVVADTRARLDLPNDARIRLIRVGPGAGANVGRQVGIQESFCDVIALIDDDDEWMPDKVEVQLALTAGIAGDWIAASRVEARGLPSGTVVWPRRLIGPNEPLVDYLFRKRRVRGGTGFMQSSCLMFTRALALDVPFDPTLRFHQDIGWLIDVAHQRPDLPTLQSAAALSTYTVSPSTGSVSHRIGPEESIRWAVARLGEEDPRILGDFILTHSIVLAQRAGSVQAARKVISTARTLARPGWPARIFAWIVLLRTTFRRLS